MGLVLCLCICKNEKEAIFNGRTYDRNKIIWLITKAQKIVRGHLLRKKFNKIKSNINPNLLFKPEWEDIFPKKLQGIEFTLDYLEQLKEKVLFFYSNFFNYTDFPNNEKLIMREEVYLSGVNNDFFKQFHILILNHMFDCFDTCEKLRAFTDLVIEYELSDKETIYVDDKVLETCGSSSSVKKLNTNHNLIDSTDVNKQTVNALKFIGTGNNIVVESPRFKLSSKKPNLKNKIMKSSSELPNLNGIKLDINQLEPNQEKVDKHKKTHSKQSLFNSNATIGGSVININNITIKSTIINKNSNPKPNNRNNSNKNLNINNAPNNKLLSMLGKSSKKSVSSFKDSNAFDTFAITSLFVEGDVTTLEKELYEFTEVHKELKEVRTFYNKRGIYYIGTLHNMSQTKYGLGIEYLVNSNYRGFRYKYLGYFKNDLFHGLGILIKEDGSTYQGEFSKGRQCGYGIETSKNTIYKGFFHNNKYHGYGELTVNNKVLYRGCYNMGNKDNIGCMDYNNGTKYIGNYTLDKMNGLGLFHWPVGHYYFGEWVDDKMNGKGKYKWKNNDLFIGYYKDDLRHGPGEYYFGNKKSVLKGSWSNGKKNGIFKLFENGEIHNLNYKNDQQQQ